MTNKGSLDESFARAMTAENYEKIKTSLMSIRFRWSFKFLIDLFICDVQRTRGFGKKTIFDIAMWSFRLEN